MARRSVATLFCAADDAKAWRTTERCCKQCSAPFLPIRRDQEFCPGGDCRLAWWAEHRVTEIHRCRCGRECAGPNPNRCRGPACDGALVRDDDGGTVCLNCGRPGDEPASLQLVTRPARREAVQVG